MTHIDILLLWISAIIYAIFIQPYIFYQSEWYEWRHKYSIIFKNHIDKEQVYLLASKYYLQHLKLGPFSTAYKDLKELLNDKPQ